MLANQDRKVRLGSAPKRPSGVMAAAGDGKVTLNWSASNDPGIKRYQVRYRVSLGSATSRKHTGYNIGGGVANSAPNSTPADANNHDKAASTKEPE